MQKDHGNIAKQLPAKIVLLLVLVALIFPSSAWSQQAIDSLVITNLDSSNFPAIRLQVLARNASGQLLKELPGLLVSKLK